MTEPKEQTKVNKMSIEKYLGNIVSMHNLPCLVLIKIDVDHKFIVEGIASNTEALNLVLAEKDAEKEKPDYMG